MDTARSRLHHPARRSGPRRAVRSGLLLGVLILAGCAGGSMAEDPFAGAAGSNQIEIEVQNLNWSQATLHFHRGGDRRRLGVVSGKKDASFTVPWTHSLPLQIEVDLLAAGACITRPLQVSPGDIVVLHIESRFDMTQDCRPLARS